MMASSILQNRMHFNQVLWMVFTLMSVVVLGFYLAFDSFLALFAMAGFIWLVTLPYHSRLSVYISIATFASALILPFAPGRPMMWEFAAVMGWSGLVVTLFMRQYAPGYFAEMHRHRWIFIGIAGYCVVLLSIMLYRGVGMRIMGSTQFGGRFYFQQLICAIFPALFLIVRPSEKALTRLVILQCILSSSFFVSDFVWSRAPREIHFILQFFELPGDAMNFEVKASQFGIRRYQSLREVSQGVLFFLLIRYSVAQFLTRKGLFLLPISLGVFVLGLYSGHRILVLCVVMVLLTCAYAQRFFSPKHLLAGSFIATLLLAVSYVFADSMPLPVQRGLSFLPGINVDYMAADDGDGTIVARRILRQIGLEMAPQYLWMGRGFGMTSIEDFSSRWDPSLITMHVNQGRFFNGVIGLLVNTGLAGTVCMLVFLLAGTRLAWQIVRQLRVVGSGDPFLRVCALVAGIWLQGILSFLFLHGDSEYAMKTFALQSALLLACHHHLTERIARMNEAALAARAAASQAQNELPPAALPAPAATPI